MIKSVKAITLAGALCGAFSVAAYAEAEDISQDGESRAKTAEYTATYVLSRRGTERGEASRVLQREDDEQWRYYTESSARLLILSDRRENETLFQMEDGRVKPLLFDYAREGTGPNKYLRVRFDYENKQVVSEGEDDVDVEWQDNLLDPNAVLHQLQLDVAGNEDSWTYPLVDERGNFRDYEFARAGTETLELPYGTYETIKVERVRDHDRRETYFWFAPELNYTLVKMQQIKEGKEQLQIQLTELDL